MIIFLKKRTKTAVLLFLLIPGALSAQEFHTYENGLIYSEKAVKRLYFIADSLNIQFRKCEIRPSWTSFEQAYGFSYYENDSADIEKLVRQLEAGDPRASIERTVKPGSVLRTDTSLLIRFNQFDRDSGKTLATYGALGEWSLIVGHETGLPGDFRSKASADGGTWYWYIGKSSYDGKAELDYYYLIADYRSYSLSKKYSDWINYSQCMVDTNTTIYLPGAKYFSGFWEREEDCRISEGQKKFLERIGSIAFEEFKIKPPGLYRGDDPEKEAENDREFEEYEQKYLAWKKKREAYIREELAKDASFPSLAETAWKEAKKDDCFTEEFVDYLGKYYNASKALDLKRSRIKMGMCSMDGSPRQYLTEIALLAAESGRWEVFLRSHLNLMNDRVPRNSDNSAAERYRGVYIKELEALPLDLKQLFPGMMFRINNAPANHYYNTLVRSAKSMALSSDPLGFYRQALEIASDTTLDPFNRVVFGHVAGNMLYFLKEDQKARIDPEEIPRAFADLPVFFGELFIEEDEE